MKENVAKNGLVLAALAAVIALAYDAGGRHAPMPDAKTPVLAAADADKILYYRNPMGLADISMQPKKDAMGMDYIPVRTSEAKTEMGAVSLSPGRIQKLGVRTEVAEKHVLARVVRAVGTVRIDETRQAVVSPRFEGWIGKLRVDATGQQVKKGDVLFDFYSPEIVQVEAEYVALADGALVAGKNGSLERLRTLAVPEEEIARLKKEKTVNNAILMRAVADGTVMEKSAVDGMKFSPGDVLYRMADLSAVWIIADVYEQDLRQVQTGQAVKVRITALPGEVFEGKVDFIYPSIAKETRTAQVRIVLPNAKNALKPDMYAAVEGAKEEASAVLAVPRSAVLNSGKAQTVLVSRGEGVFIPVAVTTGASDDGYIEIVDGLSVGDEVVISANFLIDAESNIRAALQGFSSVKGEKQ